MPIKEYWTKREELRATKLYNQADRSLKDLKAIFYEANLKINKEISYFYTQYGINTKSPTFETLKDGTQVLKGESIKRTVPMYEATKYKRLDSLKKQLNLILADMSKEQKAYMVTNLKLLAQESYTTQFFEIFKGYGTGFSFDLLDPKMVKQLIYNPVNGQDFSKRIYTNRNLLANHVEQELVNGLTQGISTQDMTKRIEKKIKPLLVGGKKGTAYRVAETLMRTEITNTYAQATLQGYRDSGIVKEYEYLATLDKYTSSICQDLDGQVFKIDKATTGLNYPPMHPNCRSTTLSKFDDDVFERRARDEEGNTYTVPSNMNYKEWKAVHVDKTMTQTEWKRSK